MTAAGTTVTWRALWLETAERLGGDAPAAAEARWICEEVSGAAGIEWAACLDEPATTRAVARLDALVARRQHGEPLQYVLGSWAFRRIDLMVDRRVLIPRAETEQLVDVALELAAGMPRPLLIADLGTGSGAIALALAYELPLSGVEVWATDVSLDALDVARANLSGLGRAGANVRLAHGDWFDALDETVRGRFDLVVSNPPYIADGDPEVEEPVRAWEPARALFAGPDGLDAVRRIVGDAGSWLRSGGWLVLEIGARHGRVAADLAAAAGLTDVTVRPDLAGHDRVLIARRPSK